MRTMKYSAIAVALMLILFLAGACAYVDANDPPARVQEKELPLHQPAETADPESSPNINEPQATRLSPPPVIPPEPTGKTTLLISAVGDIMVHRPQVDSAKRPDAGYDFKPVFGYIKPFIEMADIALGNLETTISTREKGYFGFPLFRSPEEVLEALKYAGFDVITTANNHSLDGREFGLEHTLDKLDEYRLLHTGTARNPEERDRVLIIDRNDIKIAILAYTYGTNGMEAAVDQQRLEYMVNYFHDFDEVAQDIQRAREQGAELVIACLHWGDEYSRTLNQQQRELAQKLLVEGVDIILGSHPHVLQPIERKTFVRQDGIEREGLVVYSMGNFVSNQRKQYRDSGMIINVEIIKDYDLKKVYIGKVSYVPTWVHRYTEDGNLEYRILPVGIFLDKGMEGEAGERLRAVWNETTEHVGDFEPVR